MRVKMPWLYPLATLTAPLKKLGSPGTIQIGKSWNFRGGVPIVPIAMFHYWMVNQHKPTNDVDSMRV